MKSNKIIDHLFENDKEESYQDIFKEVNKSRKSCFRDIFVKASCKFKDSPWIVNNLILALVVAFF